MIGPLLTAIVAIAVSLIFTDTLTPGPVTPRAPSWKWFIMKYKLWRENVQIKKNYKEYKRRNGQG